VITESGNRHITGYVSALATCMHAEADPLIIVSCDLRVRLIFRLDLIH